jgi:predicted TIM-barrel fold metal-dependent hydrolase
MRIVDAHCHLYDSAQNRYPQLEQTDAMFEALIGDYSSLPRRHLLADYMAQAGNLEIAGLVWHEFMAEDPIQEVRWAQELASTSPVPISIVGLVDFLAPELDSRLDIYSGCNNVSAVREHLGWDQDNPLRRFAKRPDLLTDASWLRGLAALERYNFKCSLEVFASQLTEVANAVRAHPKIGFTIVVMGWPLALDADSFARWARTL